MESGDCFMSVKFWRYKAFFIFAVAAIGFTASENLAAGESFEIAPKTQYIRFNSELNCVEALVHAPVPGNSTAKAAERILQARERAELLLYVRLVDFLFGAQIEGWDMRRSTVRSTEDKNTVDRVSGNAVQMSRERDIGGHITRHIELSPLQWDGRFFEMYGRFSMPQISRTQEGAEEKSGKKVDSATSGKNESRGKARRRK
jgi:hypothetical protein